MIIGHVNLAHGFRGGERQTEILIRELASHGHEQIVIVRSGAELGRRLADVPNLKIRAISKPYILNIGAARGCTLLHAHEAKACQYAYWVKRLKRTPYVITRRVPNVPGKNLFTRAIYQNADAIIALSTAIKESMLEHNPSLEVMIVPSMSAQLPADMKEVTRIRERFKDKFIVGHVGALVNKHKGQSYLIEAAREIISSNPEIHFLLLGQGKDQARLKQQANDLNNVTFIGFVDNVGDYLGAFDLFVFPSLNEGLGSILIDAMQFELPIIASNVDGIPDLIEDNKNGMLVEPRDSSAISNMIINLYKDSNLRNNIASTAKAQAQKYLPQTITTKIEAIYERCL